MLRVTKSHDIAAMVKNDSLLHATVRIAGARGLCAFQKEIDVDVNAADAQGETALHVAAWRGDAKAVSTLLNHGACVEVRRADGQRALDLASARSGTASGCRRGSWEDVVEMLSAVHRKRSLEYVPFKSSRGELQTSQSASTIASEEDQDDPVPESNETIWFPVGWEYFM